jgi:predicted transcriptional regulator
LGLILNSQPVILKFDGGGDTCGEIGKELVVSRASILKDFDDLIECGLIASEKENG